MRRHLYYWNIVEYVVKHPISLTQNGCLTLKGFIFGMFQVALYELDGYVVYTYNTIIYSPGG